MAEALRWWLWLELMTLVSLPLCGLLFRSLPDRGYALSKAFGWITAGWLAWLAASFGLAPFGGSSSRLAVLALALVSVSMLLMHKGGYLRAWLVFFRELTGYVVAVEAAFLLAFLALLLLRAHMPEASGTEKPMEYMYLQAAYSARYMPPPDLWLSGHTTNYYYFGFYLHAFLARLSGVPPAIAFNLALATTWAVSLVTLAGVGYNAVAAGSPARAPRLLGALLAPLLVLFIGNPAGTFEWWRAWREQRGFDWWGPSRVVADTIPGRPSPSEPISEFPAFSFLLGDLHPHVMAMPLFTLGVSASLALALYMRRPRVQLLVGAVTAGVIVGWLYMTNSWDVPVVAALAVASPVVGAQSGRLRERLRMALLVPLPLLLAAALAAMPFLASFEAPVHHSAELPEWVASVPLLATLGRYLGVVWWDHSEVLEFLGVWGVHVLLLVLALLATARAAGPNGWAASAAVAAAALVPAALLDAPVLLLLAPVIVLCLHNAWCLPSISLRWGFLLSGVGWTLVLLPEILFLRDVFDDRMNTVFKLYYQAWQLLGISYAVLLLGALDHLSLHVTGGHKIRLATPVVVTVLLLSLAYPYAGVRERSAGGYNGLDASAFLRDDDRDAYKIVEWLRKNTRPSDVVLEATGGQYSLYARLATYAGRPTVLGWAGHEQQWRLGQPELLREIASRSEDVASIYDPDNAEEARALLERYAVKYVYYGDLEREMQAERSITVRDPFEGVLTPVSRSGDSVLYEAPQQTKGGPWPRRVRGEHAQA